MQASIENFLNSAGGASSVVAHARLLIRLQNFYRKLAPSYLSESSTVANYKLGIIVIHADNGAVAAKLRQMATTLAGDFSRFGVECNGVQIRVQASQPLEKPRPQVHRPLSARAGGTMSELAKTLPVGSLKSALEQFLDRVEIDKGVE